MLLVWSQTERISLQLHWCIFEFILMPNSGNQRGLLSDLHSCRVGIFTSFILVPSILHSQFVQPSILEFLKTLKEDKSCPRHIWQIREHCWTASDILIISDAAFSAQDQKQWLRGLRSLTGIVNKSSKWWQLIRHTFRPHYFDCTAFGNIKPSSQTLKTWKSEVFQLTNTTQEAHIVFVTGQISTHTDANSYCLSSAEMSS